MAPIFDSLKQELKAGKVIVPGDADYDDSIKRWSASCVKPAVSGLIYEKPAPRATEKLSCEINNRQQ